MTDEIYNLIGYPVRYRIKFFSKLYGFSLVMAGSGFILINPRPESSEKSKKFWIQQRFPAEFISWNFMTKEF
jgi:hypothetical protein